MSASGGTQSDIFKRYSRLHLGDCDTAPRRRAPGFKTRPHGVKLNNGDRLELIAELLGHPPPRVVWLKDGVEIKDTQYSIHSSGHNHSLVVDSVTKECSY